MAKDITPRYGVSLLDNLLVTHEQVLELIDEEKLTELGEMASDGCTLHEMSVVLGISFGEFILARAKSEDFDKFCQILETVAAGKHLASARRGIKNPQEFSAAAYDRVMGALGFTPHVSHVSVASSDGAAEKLGRVRVGFDVEEFRRKHENNGVDPEIPITKAPIDVTPEQVQDPVEDDWERDKDDWEDLM